MVCQGWRNVWLIFIIYCILYNTCTCNGFKTFTGGIWPNSNCKTSISSYSCKKVWRCVFGKFFPSRYMYCVQQHILVFALTLCLFSGYGTPSSNQYDAKAILSYPFVNGSALFADRLSNDRGCALALRLYDIWVWEEGGNKVTTSTQLSRNAWNIDGGSFLNKTRGSPRKKDWERMSNVTLIGLEIN